MSVGFQSVLSDLSVLSAIFRAVSHFDWTRGFTFQWFAGVGPIIDHYWYYWNISHYCAVIPFGVSGWPTRRSFRRYAASRSVIDRSFLWNPVNSTLAQDGRFQSDGRKHDRGQGQHGKFRACGCWTNEHARKYCITVSSISTGVVLDVVTVYTR